MDTQIAYGKPKKAPARLSLSLKARDHSTITAELFTRLLCLERKRAERSRKPFALMLIDVKRVIHRRSVLDPITSALAVATRETDLVGWYEAGSVLGIIFTEISETEPSACLYTLLARVNASLQESLGPELFLKLHVSVHRFPDEWDDENPEGPADSKLYPDLMTEEEPKRLSRLIKRAIDVSVSLALLVLLSPVFGIISLLIKLTSKGPVLFRQERMGRFGKKFGFLKFRSMYDKNDPSIHKEYVAGLISGDAVKQSNGNGRVYKIKNDPRITPIGRFLRKTSLDEIPQFWNVLKGEMSLVGPRPPIPYEVASYAVWHRRRLLEARPGITGLWQVRARSRTTFEEMVRLDLEYSKTWSLGLDFKIILLTPRAVLSGDGAY